MSNKCRTLLLFCLNFILHHYATRVAILKKFGKLPKNIDGGGNMKKLGVVLLAVALAFGVMGGGVSYLSAEDSAEKVPGDFTSAANLFVETDDLLDSYAVDAESVSNRPYPADWGMKFGKTNEGEYTCMNNERQERANQAKPIRLCICR